MKKTLYFFIWKWRKISLIIDFKISISGKDCLTWWNDFIFSSSVFFIIFIIFFIVAKRFWCFITHMICLMVSFCRKQKITYSIWFFVFSLWNKKLRRRIVLILLCFLFSINSFTVGCHKYEIKEEKKKEERDLLKNQSEIHSFLHTEMLANIRDSEFYSVLCTVKKKLFFNFYVGAWRSF